MRATKPNSNKLPILFYSTIFLIILFILIVAVLGCQLFLQ